MGTLTGEPYDGLYRDGKIMRRRDTIDPCLFWISLNDAGYAVRFTPGSTSHAAACPVEVKPPMLFAELPDLLPRTFVDGPFKDIMQKPGCRLIGLPLADGPGFVATNRIRPGTSVWALGSEFREISETLSIPQDEATLALIFPLIFTPSRKPLTLGSWGLVSDRGGVYEVQLWKSFQVAATTPPLVACKPDAADFDWREDLGLFGDLTGPGVTSDAAFRLALVSPPRGVHDIRVMAFNC